ncbi:uncharacterized protein LOC135373145 [Ornithodoros turicata]|uniref:uncharacterized protein LOC135373145 n=1 Tax=Ornithodoros turicata TaxID=34597 RepID=UPI0031390BC8
MRAKVLLLSSCVLCLSLRNSGDPNVRSTRILHHGDNPSAAPPVAHVPSAAAVKLPPYWNRNPATWFAQAEAQFHLSEVTSQLTKFYHVVSALSPAAADEVYDVITTTPPDNPYDSLKSALRTRTTTSARSRQQQLLSAEELGDTRPTQLLRRMKQLLSNSTPTAGGDFLRELFLQRLPRNVQMILATASTLAIDELAALADAVMEVATPTPVDVNAVHTPQAAHIDRLAVLERSPRPVSVDDLAQQVSSLTQLVATLATRSRSPSPVRSRSRPSSRSARRPRSGSAQSDGLCWYRRWFGADAHHCLLPCTWTGNPPANH